MSAIPIPCLLHVYHTGERRLLCVHCSKAYKHVLLYAYNISLLRRHALLELLIIEMAYCVQQNVLTSCAGELCCEH